MPLIHAQKPDRSRIDLADEAVAKRWAKKLGKSRAEIAAAIEKVGDNCETVRKELGVKDDDACAPPAKTAAKTATKTPA